MAKKGKAALTVAQEKQIMKDAKVDKALEMLSFDTYSWVDVAKACGYASVAGAKRAVDRALKKVCNPDFALRVQVLGVNRIERLLIDTFEEYKLLRTKALLLDSDGKDSSKAWKDVNDRRDAIAKYTESQCKIANVDAFAKSLAGVPIENTSINNTQTNNNYIYHAPPRMDPEKAKNFKQLTDAEIELPPALKMIYDKKKNGTNGSTNGST